MGNVISNFFHKELHCLMIGSDKDDQTTILNKLTPNKKKNEIPTIHSFHMSTKDVKIEKNNATIHITVCNLPTQPKTMLLWRHQFSRTDCIIWCIDSTLNEYQDVTSTNDALKQDRDMMNTVMSHQEIKNDIPLLIYITKTGSKTSISTEKVKQLLHFELKPQIDDLRNCCLCHKMNVIDEILTIIIEYLPDDPQWIKYKRKNNLIRFQRCSALTGQGLMDGLEWLTSESNINVDSNNRRT